MGTGVVTNGHVNREQVEKVARCLREVGAMAPTIMVASERPHRWDDSTEKVKQKLEEAQRELAVLLAPGRLDLAQQFADRLIQKAGDRARENPGGNLATGILEMAATQEATTPAGVVDGLGVSSRKQLGKKLTAAGMPCCRDLIRAGMLLGILHKWTHDAVPLADACQEYGRVSYHASARMGDLCGITPTEWREKGADFDDLMDRLEAWIWQTDDETDES